MKKLNCLDLFCGAGGMSVGFELAGFNIVAGIDNNEEALYTFSQNHKKSIALNIDLSLPIDFSDDVWTDIAKVGIDVIVGGPPCQGFSVAGKRDAKDPRNKLYKAYLNMIDYFSPTAVVLENVPTILSLYGGNTAASIMQDFESKGYKCIHFILKASDYGVPQIRRRAFFVGLKNGYVFQKPNETTLKNPISTEDALSDLPILDVDLGGDEMNYASLPLTPYQTFMRKGSMRLFNHWAVAHTEKTKSIIHLVPDGGNYKNLPKKFQSTRRVNIAWTRMNSKKPCFTIDAGHNHHFHYKANRVPTVRECARIQSFPDFYRFYGKKVSQFRQVGNAVPPLLAMAVAKELIRKL